MSLPMDFSLRNATTDDLSAVSVLDRKLNPPGWSVDHFREELDKPNHYFVLMTDDETDECVLGYCVFWIQEGETRLLTLGVDPEYRGLGIAKKLLGTMVKYSLQARSTKIALEVRLSNKGAISLYNGVGYKAVREQKGFYSDGETAVFMELDLTRENTPVDQ